VKEFAMNAWWRVVISGGVAMLVAGCADAQEPVVAPSKSVSSAACGAAASAQEALARINRFRAAPRSCGAEGRFAAVPPVRWNDALARAAADHAGDMAQRRYFAHVRAGGPSLQQRVEKVGYDWRAIGENIAAGPGSVAAAVEGWQRSDPHCANLMSPDFSEIGLACTPATRGDRYDNYWTLDFGKRR
jgi:uncharacterized protein YkwD